MAHTRVQNILRKTKQDTMTKRDKIIYWDATLWLALGLVSTGAIYSRLASGDPVTEILPVVLLLVLAMVSWYFRPVDRKLNPV
jgi:hypothetical protein